MDKNLPKGMLFTELYVDKGSPTNDSNRFRRSLYAFFSETQIFKDQELQKILAKWIEMDIGIKVPIGMGTMRDYYKWENFFLETDIESLLVVITIIWRILAKKYSIAATEWVNDVNECFQRHNLFYRTDENGGVHLHPDKEFVNLKTSALSCLNDAKYKRVAEVLTEAYKKLNIMPPETKIAISEIFESLEILYKIIVNSESKDRLTEKNIKEKLLPIIQRHYSKSDNVAKNVAQNLMNSFIDWVNGVHEYRHGQNNTLRNPPLDLTISIMSLGTSFLRWLATIDIENNR